MYLRGIALQILEGSRCVEYIDCDNLEITGQKLKVCLTTMEDLDDPWVLKDVPQT